MHRTPALKVGFVPGVTPGKWTARWRERHPELPLELSEYDAGSQVAVLHDGRADLAFVRLPVEQDGLNVIPLYSEQPVVVASKEHFVALYDGEVPVTDLEDEKFLRVVDCGGEAAAVEIAASGAGLVVLPMSVARLYRRRDAVYRLISDTPETRIGIAWRVDNGSELIDEFIGIVRGRTANSSRQPLAGKGSPKAAVKSPAGTDDGYPADNNRSSADNRSARRGERQNTRRSAQGGTRRARRERR